MYSSLDWLKSVRGPVRVWLPCLCAAFILVPACLRAAAPAWWVGRGVINPSAPADDYAAVNQGQVKHIAKQAYEEFVAKLPNGPGAALSAIWASPATSTDDYQSINIGQLKNVAKPFYDRLIAEGVASSYPWIDSAAASDDYALANIGQVKYMFSFEPVTQQVYLIVVSGANQSGLTGEVLHAPLKVGVWDANGEPVVGAVVFFDVAISEGKLGLGSATQEGSSIQRTTGVDGSADVFLKQIAPPGFTTETTVRVHGKSVIIQNHVRSKVSSSQGNATVPGLPGLSPLPIWGVPSPVVLDADPYVLPPPEETKVYLQFKGLGKVTVAAKISTSEIASVARLKFERRKQGEDWLVLAVLNNSQMQNSGLLTSYNDVISPGVKYEYRVSSVSGSSVSAPGGIVSIVAPYIFSFAYSKAEGTQVSQMGSNTQSPSNSLAYYKEATGLRYYSAIPRGYKIVHRPDLSGLPLLLTGYNDNVSKSSWVLKFEHKEYLEGTDVTPLTSNLYFWPGSLSDRVFGDEYSWGDLVRDVESHVPPYPTHPPDGELEQGFFSSLGFDLNINKVNNVGVGNYHLAGALRYKVKAGPEWREPIRWRERFIKDGVLQSIVNQEWLPAGQSESAEHEITASALLPSERSYRLFMEMPVLYSCYDFSYANQYGYKEQADGIILNQSGRENGIRVNGDLSASPNTFVEINWSGGGGYTIDISGVKYLTASGTAKPYSGFIAYVSQGAFPAEDLIITVVSKDYSSGAILDTRVVRLRYEGTQALTYPSTDASGSAYRKIALNGRPMPDSGPVAREEEDGPAEQTYVDALTLSLEHDVSDIFVPLGTTAFELSARRRTTSAVWNYASGLRPHEHYDQPFGPGWETNLTPHIEFFKNNDGERYATVYDENGSPARFLEYTSPQANQVAYFPLPTARNDESTIFSALYKDPSSGNFVFSRKRAGKIFFESASAERRVRVDRLRADYRYDPATKLYALNSEEYVYWRATKLIDRMGNVMNYEYAGIGTLIPKRISVAGRPSLEIKIEQSTSGKINAIWDALGNKTEYIYESRPVDTGKTVLVLAEVINPVGKSTKYGYSIVSERDRTPRPNANTGDDFYHYHCNVSRIEDPEGNAYQFEYAFDHEGPGNGDYGRFAYYQNREFPELNGYYPTTGNPRVVKSVMLPGALGLTTFTNLSTLKLINTSGVFAPSNDSQRQIRIVDALDNSWVYTWSEAEVYVANGIPGDNVRPKIAYYKRMTVETPAINGQARSESYRFSPAAGMALVSATDYSGNTTTYFHADAFEASQATQSLFPGAADLHGFYNSPTRRRDALGNEKVFVYDGVYRMMTSMTDELGVRTQWVMDGNLGRYKEVRVFKANSSEMLQHTLFEYSNPDFPGFVTKQMVKVLGTSDDTLAQAQALVTLYGADSRGWVAQEVIDMNGNGEVDPGSDLIATYTYDNNGNKRTSTDANNNTTTFSYDARSRLTHVTYPDNHQKRFFYDARGNKTEEIDENGVSTFWQYDALNRLTNQIVDMNGSLQSLAAATNHVLADSMILDRSVHIITSYTYNALNAKLTVTSPNGTVTRFEYDALQRLTKKTDDYGAGHLNYVTTHEYGVNSGGSTFDSSGFKPTNVIDPRGFRTEVVYDDLYRPTQERSEYASGTYATVTKTYDPVGSLLTSTDPLGAVTMTTYDALRRPLTVTEAYGTALAATSARAYTSTGLAWQFTDPLGRITATQYDSAGRPVKAYAPAVDDARTTAPTLVSPITETRYDAAGNVIAVINSLGQRTDYAYDNRNRRYEEKLPAVVDTTTGIASHPTRTTAYDGTGNVIAVQDSRGFITSTEYDNARRPVLVTAPPVTLINGTTVTPEAISTYDSAGNVLTVTDANGHVTTNAYDALNRLKSTLQKPDANSTHDILVRNEYDAAGNRTAMIDGKSQRTEFTYDGLNRNLTIKDPASRTVAFTYDAINKVSRVDSESRQTHYTYDVRHRLIDVTYVGRTQSNRSYAYDLVGQLLTVTEPGKGGIADVAYTYDALGRIVTESAGSQSSIPGALLFTHIYAYDLASNRVQVTYGGTGTVLVSEYDAHNRLTKLTEGTRITTYGYDLNGNRVLLALPNGEETDTQYDALNRAVAITTSRASGALLLQLTQTYDSVGNLVGLTERHYGSSVKPRTVTNTYDDVNRLVVEVNTGGGSSIKTIATTYDFDRANNRTAKAVAITTGVGTTTALVETAYVYNNLNQLRTATTGTAVTHFSYDLNGNRVERVEPNALADTYAYDYENRLVGLVKNTTGGAGSYVYTYDYRTRRVERTEAGVVTKSVFSGGVSVSEYDGEATISSSPSVEYTRGSDWGGGVGGLLYSVRSGVPSFKHYNSRGDVISATDATGVATWQGTYEAYGTRTQETGTMVDRQKANTKEEDPTGLLNEGFRYRDLETGVFITRDPLGFVDGPNMYVYVIQNPWSKFDPLGLYWGEKYVNNMVSLPVNLTVNTGRHLGESAKQIAEGKPFNAIRVTIGVPGSILSGDIFDKANPVHSQATGVSVNGIWNDKTAAKNIADDTSAATGQKIEPIKNGTHWGIPGVRQKLGDVIQCLSESLGAINTPSLNYAVSMRVIDQNHPTGTLEATAHSQGGSVLMGGAALLDPSINQRTSVQTFGAQLAAPKGIFKDVYNERSSGGLIGDPVPFLDLRNLKNTLGGNISGNDQSTGHGWAKNYGVGAVRRAEKKENP